MVFVVVAPIFNLKRYETYNLHKLCRLRFCFINISSEVTNNIRYGKKSRVELAQ